MSFYKNIQIALDTCLNGAGTGLDIAWENTDYTPTLGTAYLRPTLLMAKSSLMDLDDLQLNQGIYQVDIFYPLDKGAGELLTTLDTIYSAFKTDTTLVSGTTTVYIKEISRTREAIRDEAYYSARLEISFKCYEN